MMTAYATRTGTRRNLDVLQAAGWRLLITPDTLRATAMQQQRWTDGTVAPYALDNGAWGCFQRNEPWDSGRFRACVEAVGADADWIVLPDVVAGGLSSLALSLSWLAELAGRVLLPVQDGMSPADIRPHVGGRVGIFVGGTTSWKLATLNRWGQLARETGAWLHVGRVNTARRIGQCGDVGAHSFDGTSVTRFANTASLLDDARRRSTLFTWSHPWGL
jgi:hypothetical protein